MTRRKQNFSDWLCRQQGILPQTALRYVLESMIPYTKANIQLITRPNAFFDELERRDRRPLYSRSSLRQAYYEAKRKGLIVVDEAGKFSLSAEAERSLKVFKPLKLKGALVMVIFDIPELEKRKRQWFRTLLRELKFEQVQKSVWMSEYNCFEVLSAGIIEQRLETYVRVFEARPIEER